MKGWNGRRDEWRITSKLPRRGDEDIRSGGERRNLLSGNRWPSRGVLELVPEAA